MAGLGRKIFAAGEILTAADLQGYAVDQSVMVFDDATARGSAIPSPTEGMTTYRKDAKLVETYNGTAFTPVGRILQVVSTTKDDTFSASVAGGSYAAVTGLTASITPSSTSSKILIVASITGARATSDGMLHVALTRGGTRIGGPASPGSRGAISSGAQSVTSTNVLTTVPVQFLDSPNTTSSVTYGFELYNFSGATQTLVVNRMATDTDSAAFARASSTVTLMEVAG